MHRLKDFWNHHASNAAWAGMDIEPYEEWLDRLGITEEADDERKYGDETPWWREFPPKVLAPRHFRVWTDDKSFDEVIEAPSMKEALDEAARRLGAIDYADLAQKRNWGPDEGLNIEVHRG